MRKGIDFISTCWFKAVVIRKSRRRDLCINNRSMISNASSKVLGEFFCRVTKKNIKDKDHYCLRLNDTMKHNCMEMPWISTENPMKTAKSISWLYSWPWIFHENRTISFNDSWIFHENMARNISWAMKTWARLSWGMKLPWKAVSTYFMGHETMTWDLHGAWICH